MGGSARGTGVKSRGTYGRRDVPAAAVAPPAAAVAPPAAAVAPPPATAVAPGTTPVVQAEEVPAMMTRLDE